MADITVECSEDDQGWTCEVQLLDSGSSTHSVNVPYQDFQDLTGKSEADVKTLVKESFEFLLEREPQSAIMSNFNIRTIEQFFPEFPSEISDRLNNRNL